MFSRPTLLFIAIAACIIYSCGKNTTAKPAAPASIVGKWNIGKQAIQIHDYTGKLVADTTFDNGSPYGYWEYDAAGNNYVIYIQNAAPDTMDKYTYKLAGTTLTTYFPNNSGSETGAIVQLTAHTLEIDYRVKGMGNVVDPTGLFHLSSSVPYTGDFLDYGNR